MLRCHYRTCIFTKPIQKLKLEKNPLRWGFSSTCDRFIRDIVIDLLLTYHICRLWEYFLFHLIKKTVQNSNSQWIFYLLSSPQALTWSNQLYIRFDHSLRKTTAKQNKHYWWCAWTQKLSNNQWGVHVAHLTAQSSSQERQDGRWHRCRSCDHESHSTAQTRLQSVKPNSKTDALARVERASNKD